MTSETIRSVLGASVTVETPETAGKEVPESVAGKEVMMTVAISVDVGAAALTVDTRVIVLSNSPRPLDKGVNMTLVIVVTNAARAETAAL